MRNFRVNTKMIDGLAYVAEKTDKTLPLSTLLALCYVAMQPTGALTSDLERLLKDVLPRSAIHRALQRLSTGSPSNQHNVGAGLGLIVRRQDDLDPRRFIWELTPEGLALLVKAGILGLPAQGPTIVNAQGKPLDNA